MRKQQAAFRALVLEAFRVGRGGPDCPFRHYCVGPMVGHLEF